MSREEVEEFKQDRNGNLNRALDDVRGVDGMSEENGIKSISATETVNTGETVTLESPIYTLPNDAKRAFLAHLELINTSAGSVDVTVIDAELDNSDNVTSYTVRSLTKSVSADGEYEITDYRGKDFSGDAIGVRIESAESGTDSNEITVSAEVGVAAYSDKPEEYEPSAEQTVAPSS